MPYSPPNPHTAAAADCAPPALPFDAARRELFSRTLAFLPHDDDHIGVSGLIQQLMQANCDVEMMVATSGDNHQPHARRLVTAAERSNELKEVAKALGLRCPRIGFRGCDGRLHKIPRNRVVGWIDRAISTYRPTALLLP